MSKSLDSLNLAGPVPSVTPVVLGGRALDSASVENVTKKDFAAKPGIDISNVPRVLLLSHPALKWPP